MAQYRVRVSDEVTYARERTLDIEADDEDQAIKKALEIALAGGVDWSEERFENTPYEAEIIGEDEEGDEA